MSNMPHIDYEDPRYAEAAAEILRRHNSGEAEANITSAIRDFLTLTKLVKSEEIKEENAPALGSRQAVDLTALDTFIEIKKRIGNGLNPNPEHVQQLDDYLEQSNSHGHASQVTAPIYLGDALQLRTNSAGLFASHDVTVQVGDEQNTELVFPLSLVERADAFDSLLSSVSQAIERDTDPLLALDDAGITDKGEQTTLKSTIDAMQRLHAEGRDHIWAYYTRNLVRPVALHHSKVDVILAIHHGSTTTRPSASCARSWKSRVKTSTAFGREDGTQPIRTLPASSLPAASPST